MNKFKSFVKKFVPGFIIGFLIVLIFSLFYGIFSDIRKDSEERYKIIELEKKNSSMEVIEYYVHHRGSFYVLEHKETKKKSWILRDSTDRTIYIEYYDGYWERFKYSEGAPHKLIEQECSDGFYNKYEYDSDGNQIYHGQKFKGRSNFVIMLDKRVKEVTLEEIAEKFGVTVDKLKIKK
jgi:hypothetical protein